MMERDQRPRSAVSGLVGLAGMAGLVAWIAVAGHWGMDGPMAGMAAVVACGLPMVAWSLFVDKVHRRPSTGIDWALRRPWAEVRETAFTKLAGLWATWAAIAAFYALGRWYWQGGYVFAMHLLAGAVPVLLLLSVPYVLWIDRRLITPRDGAYAFGQWLTGRGHDRDAVIRHARAWGVKGFFTAFMLSIVPGNWHELMHRNLGAMATDPMAAAFGLIMLMFLIDVAFATVGYVLTMRPLDAHIRSANPYLGGWVAALACYPPFILIARGGVVDYETGGANWSWWLAGSPRLTLLYMMPLVALTGFYAWATVAFGLRFSNLTHRGIITNGPYRFTKHPAYLAKVLFWWLSAIPFLTVAGDWTAAVRNCVMLGVVSGIYYWRARTEEKHLGADPDYRAYAAWMDRHGVVPRLFARVGLRTGGW
ncbi:methyltransferase family protein [Sphingomonas montana]|uniref:methyltransferase family protein n=1 Tax=Sphingomonas montana TaxID=1843236 RepID=UPI00096F5FC9|nr:isoprenylcysteine carboxylmethyltransferase family protein [Sphingomonas montana]